MGWYEDLVDSVEKAAVEAGVRPAQSQSPLQMMHERAYYLRGNLLIVFGQEGDALIGPHRLPREAVLALLSAFVSEACHRSWFEESAKIDDCLHHLDMVLAGQVKDPRYTPF